ncbi:hypothetical protein GG804_25070 [Sphingomonas histidinilytica]|uniref:hypothetical protein n=1 Tax=Rhizorhabdus histidinilytica TaxID=439228 RepID=UPI001ADAA0B9|nr:hypothetical protein [Rhizorhabdus histidinilytica]MBO9380044.1 hypothetical protein [Rhizorhabdus histidinilytica]
MTDTLTACARAATLTLRHHGVEMHPDDIRGLVVDVFTAFSENVSAEMVKAMQAIFARHCDQRGSFASIILNTDAELIVRNMIRAAVGEK